MKLRMVDQILEWTPRCRIRGIKAVSFEEYCADSTRARARARALTPELPPSLVLHGALDLANWLAILSSDYRQIALPLEFDEVRFDGGAGPADRLLLDVLVREWDERTIVLDAEARTGQRLILSLKHCGMELRPLDRYCDDSDLRVLFSEIYRPRKASLA